MDAGINCKLSPRSSINFGQGLGLHDRHQIKRPVSRPLSSPYECLAWVSPLAYLVCLFYLKACRSYTHIYLRVLGQRLDHPSGQAAALTLPKRQAPAASSNITSVLPSSETHSLSISSAVFWTLRSSALYVIVWLGIIFISGHSQWKRQQRSEW